MRANLDYSVRMRARSGLWYHRKMMLAALVLVAAAETTPAHVNVSAAYVPPARAGAPAHVAVTLAPRDPDVRVNEEPAPRLKLDEGQAVLIDKQPPPARGAAYDPAKARYLDPALPVHFPVALRPDAARGKQNVKARVTYFYCSKREGWCRKGTGDVEFVVDAGK